MHLAEQIGWSPSRGDPGPGKEAKTYKASKRSLWRMLFHWFYCSDLARAVTEERNVGHVLYFHNSLQMLTQGHALGHLQACDEVGPLLWMSNGTKDLSWVWRWCLYFYLEPGKTNLSFAWPDSTRQCRPLADYIVAVTAHGPWFQMEETKIPLRENPRKIAQI